MRTTRDSRHAVFPVERGRADFYEQLTQQILNRRTTQDKKRTIEALASFAYPSNPSQALSTIFLDKVSALTFKIEIESYPAALSHIILSLWSQCIDETYVGRTEVFSSVIFILKASVFSCAFTDGLDKLSPPH